MRSFKVHNNLFIPENFKYVEVNNTPPNTIKNKNFLNGLQNARSLLDRLEKSFEKSCKYEDMLLRCLLNHSNSHGPKDRWSNENLTSEEAGSFNKAESYKTRNFTDVTEYWPAMGVACLQYQYVKLSKCYQTLLSAYYERCNSLSSRDRAIVKLRKRITDAHAALAGVNKSVLVIGEKYLTLKYKRLSQKVWYEERIELLKRASRAVFLSAERARQDLDKQLARSLACEQDTAIILLLESPHNAIRIVHDRIFTSLIRNRRNATQVEKYNTKLYYRTLYQYRSDILNLKFSVSVLDFI